MYTLRIVISCLYPVSKVKYVGFVALVRRTSVTFASIGLEVNEDMDETDRVKE